MASDKIQKIHRSKEYQTIVALNNIGLSLLTKHRYLEASATLEDAYRLIKAMVSKKTSISAEKFADQSNTGTQIVEAIGNISLSNLVDKASRHHASSSFFKNKSLLLQPEQSGSNERTNSNEISEVSDEMSPSLFTNTSIYQNIASQFAIRIDSRFAAEEAVCDDLNQQQENLNVTVAIVLLNISVVMRCRANETSSKAYSAESNANIEKASCLKKKAIRAMHSAFRFSQKAHSILSLCSTEREKQRNNFNAHRLLICDSTDRFHLVSLLVLKQLTEVAKMNRARRHLHNYSIYSECLHNKIKEVGDHEKKTKHLKPTNVVASAA